MCGGLSYFLLSKVQLSLCRQFLLFYPLFPTFRCIKCTGAAILFLMQYSLICQDDSFVK